MRIACATVRESMVRVWIKGQFYRKPAGRIDLDQSAAARRRRQFMRSAEDKFLHLIVLITMCVGQTWPPWPADPGPGKLAHHAETRRTGANHLAIRVRGLMAHAAANFPRTTR